MRTSLPERLSALRDVVELGKGRLDDRLLDRAQAVVNRAGERLALSASYTVVALAGATGSGKSSLFNALAGAPLSQAGVRRPTTGTASAAVWEASGEDGAEFGPLLDWLGVSTRHVLGEEPGGRHAGLVLLDLPDHDSTVLNHRLEVDRLVALVDLLVWVVDPQKYADAALHENYLRKLSAHDGVTVVLLNQIDRLSPEAADQCLTDVRRLLDADGLEGAAILGVSARTGAGLPVLEQMLSDAGRRREAHTARIGADLSTVTAELREAAGFAEAADPARIGRRERAQLVSALSVAAGVPVVGEAVQKSYLRQAAGATGWPFTRWLRGLRPDPLRRLHLPSGGSSAAKDTDAAPLARSSLPTPTPAARSRVESALRGVVSASTAGLPDWEVAAVRRTAAEVSSDLSDALDRAVVGTDLGPMRLPAWQRLFGAVQWALALATLAGLAWLAVIFVVTWFQLPPLPTPTVPLTPGGPAIAVPTALALGGAVAGLLLAALGRALARIGARRRRRRAEARLRAAVEQVVENSVLGPVREELERYRQLRNRLSLVAPA